MTVDLNMMLDLRDLQVAMDVAKRAELGWFDVEFTMYGTCFSQDGQRYFRVSAQADKIYDWIENGWQQGLLCTALQTLTRTCPVPTGMKEEIALDVQKQLARTMREAFPQAFFDFMQEIAVQASSDDALPLLLAEREKAEGCFDAEKLRRFQTLLDYAYTCLKITAEHYRQLHHWLAQERRSMEDIPHSKDIFEKTFYAIAYQTPQGLVYVGNAQKAPIYAKKFALEQTGIFVTPIYAKTYWYNYTKRLTDVRRQFEQDLRQNMDADYVQLVQKIGAQNNCLSAEALETSVALATERFGSQAALTLKQYGHRWGIIE